MQTKLTLNSGGGGDYPPQPPTFCNYKHHHTRFSFFSNDLNYLIFFLPQNNRNVFKLRKMKRLLGLVNILNTTYMFILKDLLLCNIIGATDVIIKGSLSNFFSFLNKRNRFIKENK